jgi:hypothetical protein
VHTNPEAADGAGNVLAAALTASPGLGGVARRVGLPLSCTNISGPGATPTQMQGLAHTKLMLHAALDPKVPLGGRNGARVGVAKRASKSEWERRGGPRRVPLGPPTGRRATTVRALPLGYLPIARGFGEERRRKKTRDGETTVMSDQVVHSSWTSGNSRGKNMGSAGAPLASQRRGVDIGDGAFAARRSCHHAETWALAFPAPCPPMAPRRSPHRRAVSASYRTRSVERSSRRVAATLAGNSVPEQGWRPST